MALWRRAADYGDRDRGEHSLEILVDADHYSVVRQARDEATRSIVVACDIFGSAAETSVLIPSETAAAGGIDVTLIHARTAQRLVEEGIEPDAVQLEKRGLRLRNVPELHGKFLGWDHSSLAVTSFNWLSADIKATAPHGYEVGILVSGDDFLAGILAQVVKSTGEPERTIETAT